MRPFRRPILLPALCSAALLAGCGDDAPDPEQAVPATTATDSPARGEHDPDSAKGGQAGLPEFSPPEVRLDRKGDTIRPERGDSDTSARAVAKPAPVPPPPPAPAPQSEKAPAPQSPPRPAPSAQPAPAASVPPGETGEWVLQVGLHKTRESAERQVAQLRRKGIATYVVEMQAQQTDLSGTYFRVRIGRFASRAQALEYGKSVLDPLKLSFWADLKKNEAQAPTP